MIKIKLINNSKLIQDLFSYLFYLYLFFIVLLTLFFGFLGFLSISIVLSAIIFNLL